MVQSSGSGVNLSSWWSSGAARGTDLRVKKPDGTARLVRMVDLIEKLYMTLEHGAKEDEQGLLDEFLQRISHHPQSLHGVLGSDQEVWEMLVVYALERRFGWSENSGGALFISSAFHFYLQDLDPYPLPGAVN